MKQAYQEISGFEPVDYSDVGIRFQVLAGEISKLYQSLQDFSKQLFVEDSTGEYLDKHAELRSIRRKPSDYSQGFLTFSRQTPAPADLPIPSSTLVSTSGENPLEFFTLQDGVIPIGESSVKIPAISTKMGEIGNVAAGQIRLMRESVPGVSAVINEEAFSGGTDCESDDSLRARLLDSYQNISNGTNSAYYYDIAMGWDGVQSVQVIPRARGRGTVDVIVSTWDTSQESQIISELNQHFLFAREINVDVLVKSATVKSIGIIVDILPQPDQNWEFLQGTISKTIANYISALTVGDHLYSSALTHAMMQIDGVENCKVLSPAQDILCDSQTILRSNSILVERMEA